MTDAVAVDFDATLPTMTRARQASAAPVSRPSPEEGVVFPCQGEELVGILHPGAASASVGVLVVVGGPQYRVGSHRQFVLLARHLAAAGIPVLRFDYRGMGDSGGAPRDFTRVSADIAAAVEAFLRVVPGLGQVVIWGLCDAATAAAFYAPSDARVCGLVLLNPWVHTEQGAAQTQLRHYYHRRLLQAEFWHKLIRLRFDWRQSWRSFRELVRRSGWLPGQVDGAAAAAGRSLPQRMVEGVGAFRGPVLVVLSGNDLTAAEFRDCMAASQEWRAIMRRPAVRCRDLSEADHTFSRREWRDQVAQWTADWVRELWPQPPPRPGARPGKE